MIVVGAGNEATCAALSAKENGASVLQLEVSPEHWRGGNSAFSAAPGASSIAVSTIWRS